MESISALKIFTFHL